MKPLFTIITPVYNREKIVVSTIESVINQSYDSWEYIIVDDCSTDRTWSVISDYARKDERIHVWKRDRHPKGAQTCRNVGISQAQGKFLIFLDSDDLLKPFCLKQRAKFIQDNPGFDLAIFPKKPIKHTDINSILKSFLRYRIPVQTTDSLWAKSFIENIGGLNEKLTRFQDVELTIRALLVDDLLFQCSLGHEPDSIYNYQANISYGNNSAHVFDALIKFIKEITIILELNNSNCLKSNLRYYLCSWLIHYNDDNHFTQTDELIDLFYNHRIISYKIFRVLLGLQKITNSFVSQNKTIVKIIYYSLFKVT